VSERFFKLSGVLYNSNTKRNKGKGLQLDLLQKEVCLDSRILYASLGPLLSDQDPNNFFKIAI
jgi:hypothetical protein